MTDMKTMRLVANKALKYGGVKYEAGKPFTAKVKDAKVLILIGRAMVDPADALGKTAQRREIESEKTAMATRVSKPTTRAPKKTSSTRLAPVTPPPPPPEINPLVEPQLPDTVVGAVTANAFITGNSFDD